MQKEIGQLERDKKLAVPWRAMFTSKPVIALSLSIVCTYYLYFVVLLVAFKIDKKFQTIGDWAYYSVLIDLPKYMNDVLHVSVKDNGILTALPWAMFMFLSISSGFISDRLTSTGRLSMTNARKLLVTICECMNMLLFSLKTT